MLNSIISLSEKQGFFRKVISSSIQLKQLNVGPTGNLLLQNLRTEWFNNIVINSEITMFLNEDFLGTFSFAKHFCDNVLPFGIAQEFSLYNRDQQLENNCVSTDVLEFDNLFLLKDKICLNSTVFLPVNDSLPFFHKWQKQRRMWWRKVKLLY